MPGTVPVDQARLQDARTMLGCTLYTGYNFDDGYRVQAQLDYPPIVNSPPAIPPLASARPLRLDAAEDVAKLLLLQ